MMHVFPLEDDDCHELFITQSHEKNVIEPEKANILPDRNDFRAPLVSLVSQANSDQPMYEDISYNDTFKIPSSQQQKREGRCV